MPSSFGQATLFSNEADNEHSLRALFYHSGNMMNGDDITQMRQPQYEGDDARPTSRKELWVSDAKYDIWIPVLNYTRDGMLMLGLLRYL